MKVAAANLPSVASELKGRKVKNQVDPFRDCCVNAYGLYEPEWRETVRAI